MLFIKINEFIFLFSLNIFSYTCQCHRKWHSSKGFWEGSLKFTVEQDSDRLLIERNNISPTDDKVKTLRLLSSRKPHKPVFALDLRQKIKKVFFSLPPSLLFQQWNAKQIYFSVMIFCWHLSIANSIHAEKGWNSIIRAWHLKIQT